MALMDDVNFIRYTDTLGRNIVPDESTFNTYKLENVLYMQQLIDDGLVKEKQDKGSASAVCLWIEEDYKAAQQANGAGIVATSETIGSYSHSNDTKAYDIYIEKNTKSVAQNKYKWLGLYCHITTARG